MECKQTDSHIKKKFQIQLCVKKVMLTVFWDMKNIHHYWFSLKRCNSKQYFQLPTPKAKFTLFIEWPLYMVLKSIFMILKQSEDFIISNKFIWPIYEALTNTTTPSGPGSNGNEQQTQHFQKVQNWIFTSRFSFICRTFHLGTLSSQQGVQETYS